MPIPLDSERPEALAKLFLGIIREHCVWGGRDRAGDQLSCSQFKPWRGMAKWRSGDLAILEKDSAEACFVVPGDVDRQLKASLCGTSAVEKDQDVPELHFSLPGPAGPLFPYIGRVWISP